MYVPATPANFPSHRPHGRLTFCSLFAGRRCLCPGWHSVNRELPDLLQHSFPSACQPRLQTSHRPDGKLLTWEIADVLASTLACTTANASINYSMYVPQRPSKVPIAPMGKLLMCLPRLSLAQLRPMLWSTTVGEACRDLAMFPSPHGKIADMLASTHSCTTTNDALVNFSGGACHRDLENFPSPRWEIC
jgi:hypothetical protein